MGTVQHQFRWAGSNPGARAWRPEVLSTGLPVVRQGLNGLSGWEREPSQDLLRASLMGPG